MRVKGREIPVYAFDKQTGGKADSGTGELDGLWFKKINYDEVDFPIVGRPRGGAKVTFFSYSNLPDLALSIKEDARPKFKNTSDVHRAAHYIGMQILGELFKNGSTAGKVGMLPREFWSKMVENENREADKKMLRAEFKRLFDSVNDGLLGVTECERILDGFIDEIEDEEIKEWAISDIEKIFTSEEERLRSANRIRVRRFREKKGEGDYGTE